MNLTLCPYGIWRKPRCRIFGHVWNFAPTASHLICQHCWSEPTAIDLPKALLRAAGVR